MTQRTTEMPSVKNLEAGATGAYVNLPTGLTYDQLLSIGNFHPKGMVNIRVKIGTKVVQTFKDGVELTNWNDKYNRRTNIVAGMLHFYGIRPELHDYLERRLTAWGTADVSQFRVVFDVAASLFELDGTTPLASAPALVFHAKRSEQQPLGVFTRITPHQENYSTTSDQIWDDLNWSGRLSAMHLIGGGISKWTLKLNDVEFSETTKAVNDEFEKCSHFPRSEVTGWNTIDFIAEGETDEALISELFNDKRLNFTNGSTGIVRMLVETLDALDVAA